MSAGDEPLAEVVDGHESGVDDADVNAPHGDDSPACSCMSALDCDAIVAPALLEIVEPLLDAQMPAIDAVGGWTQRPNLDVLAGEPLQLS